MWGGVLLADDQQQIGGNIGGEPAGDVNGKMGQQIGTRGDNLQGTPDPLILEEFFVYGHRRCGSRVIGLLPMTVPIKHHRREQVALPPAHSDAPGAMRDVQVTACPVDQLVLTTGAESVEGGRLVVVDLEVDLPADQAGPLIPAAIAVPIDEVVRDQRVAGRRHVIWCLCGRGAPACTWILDIGHLLEHLPVLGPPRIRGLQCPSEGADNGTLQIVLGQNGVWPGSEHEEGAFYRTQAWPADRESQFSDAASVRPEYQDAGHFLGDNHISSRKPLNSTGQDITEPEFERAGATVAESTEELTAAVNHHHVIVTRIGQIDPAARIARDIADPPDRRIEREVGTVDLPDGHQPGSVLAFQQWPAYDHLPLPQVGERFLPAGRSVAPRLPAQKHYCQCG